MSSGDRPPSRRVAAFRGRSRDGAVDRSWPIGRLLVAIVAIPVLVFVVFIVAVARSCACTPLPATAPPPPPSPVSGVVIRVDSAGLNAVSGFTLRLSDGSSVDLKLGTLENPTEFSPSHLAEHQATGNPVRAFYRNVAGVPTVYRLEDATRPT